MSMFSEIASIQARINSLSSFPSMPPTVPASVARFGLAGPPYDPQAAAKFQNLIANAIAQGPGAYTGYGFSAPMAPASLEPLIQSTASKYGVDPALVKAVIANESGFNPTATSSTGAQGLMQLMPATAASLGVQNSYDPMQNIQAGTRYLRGLYDRFGDWRLAVAAYNAGPEAVRQYGGIPPYRETQNYVTSVFGSLQKYMGA